MNLLDILNINLKSLVKCSILVTRFIYNSRVTMTFYRIANDYYALPPSILLYQQNDAGYILQSYILVFNCCTYTGRGKCI